MDLVKNRIEHIIAAAAAALSLYDAILSLQSRYCRVPENREAYLHHGPIPTHVTVHAHGF